MNASKRICRIVLAAAVLATMVGGLALVGDARAQSSSKQGAVGFSTPLTRFSLEDLFPVRSETEIETEEAYADSWRKQAAALTETATTREEQAKRMIDVKNSEIKSLKTRVKHSKKLETPAERDRLKDALKLEEQKLDALKSVQELSESEMKLAKTWDEAGQALAKATSIERQIMSLRASRSNEGGAPTSGVDSRGLSLQQSLNKQLGSVGRAMEDAGEQILKLAQQRERVLQHWESFAK